MKKKVTEMSETKEEERIYVRLKHKQTMKEKATEMSETKEEERIYVM